MKKLAIVTTILVLGCMSSSSSSTDAPPAMISAAQTTTGTAPSTSQFRNLQVLPKDISREQLLATMRSFARGLGVKCNHCHVVTATEPKEQLDFPSDAKETKRVARVMLQMVNQINGPWMDRVEQAEGEEPKTAEAGAASELRVTCWTCHRGKEEPEAPPPPPPATPQS